MTAPDPVAEARDEGYRLADEHHERALLNMMLERDRATEETRRLANEVDRLRRALAGHLTGDDTRYPALRETLSFLTSMAATSSRDWGLTRGDALFYAVLVGWGDALPGVAEVHCWSNATISQLTAHRENYAAMSASPFDRGEGAWWPLRHVGLFCDDGCGTEITADIRADNREQAYAGLRKLAVEQGWEITDLTDVCPECKPSARKGDGYHPADGWDEGVAP